MAREDSRLCIFCQALEKTSEPCPQINNAHSSQGSPTCSTCCSDGPNPLACNDKEEALLGPLRRQPSKICRRCEKYDPLGVFKDAEAYDILLEMDKYDTDERRKRNEKRKRLFELPLGKLSKLELEPSCPFCRLLYSMLIRAVARYPLDPDDDKLRLVPFRSHTREHGWQAFPMEIRKESAIFLGLSFDLSTRRDGFLARRLRPGHSAVRLAQMRHEVIALETAGLPDKRRTMNARLLGPTIDFAGIRRQMDHCMSSHGPSCKQRFPKALLKTTMVDVRERVRVPCPEGGCEYVALSYMRGGAVEIGADALEAGSALPRTIEDAMEATRQLGRRYLWVDALCIDQPQQRRAGEEQPQWPPRAAEQLRMMDLIYESASVVIVALSGTDAQAGLPGVRPGRPRVRQARETLAGYTLFTVPPTDEISYSEWDTRAWTMQEYYMARRLLTVSEHSACYSCIRCSVGEFYDVKTVEQFPKPQPDFLLSGLFGEEDPDGKEGGPAARKEDFLKVASFLSLLGDYTNRHMSFEQDSLNAFLGILNMLKRKSFPSGFIWGLPLRSHPQFLGWYHDKMAGPSPRRRPAFPSWSWAGWEGVVTMPDSFVHPTKGEGAASQEHDMTPVIVDEHDVDPLGGARRLDVEGWTVELHVRTKRDCEAFPPPPDGKPVTRRPSRGTGRRRSPIRRQGNYEDDDDHYYDFDDDDDDSMALGSVTERNMFPQKTISTGVYSCLVAQQVRSMERANGSENQRVFLIMLEWEDGPGSGDGERPRDAEPRAPPVATRKTLLTLDLDSGQDFMKAMPIKRILTLT